MIISTASYYALRLIFKCLRVLCVFHYFINYAAWLEAFSPFDQLDNDERGVIN